MKDYELTVLLHPDVEADQKKPLDKLRALIGEAGGKIIKEEVQGKRRLAYAIGGQTAAVYVYFEVSLPPDGVSKLDTAIKIADEVIRHLIVKVDEKAKAALEAAAKANKGGDGDE
ncbi:MAG: 30S ribosomal protein S6 [Candidatus Chaera renei]|uniref:Small ribosomal subunit protein bS6 n=1 Tax=Candidatus Chaera renei TaxID=2506947 RepID=A0A4Q0AIX7_9BACT|nr:MAG: 30S ribosomal protein S6 [Candidatus Chaera renei]